MVQGTVRLLSLVAAAAVVGLALVSGGLTASASTPSLSLNPNRGPGGTIVTASGSGWCASPCAAVAIAFAGETLATVVPRADGTFQTTLQVPGGAQGGPNFVNATQQTAQAPPQTNQAFASFTVTPSQPAPTTSGGQPQQTAPAGPTAQSGGASAAPNSGSGSPSSSTAPGSTSTGAGSPGGTIGDGPPRPGPGGAPVALIVALSVAAILLAAAATIALRRRRQAGL